MEIQTTSVQFSHCCVQLFVTPWTATRQASLSITNSQSLLILMSIKSVMPSNHLILCSPLLSRIQSFPASGSFQMRQFLTSGGQILELQLQHQSFQWIFRTDFFYDWLVWSPCSQGILKSLLQHHSSKASILQRSAFFTIQLFTSMHEKTIALTRWTFVDKVLSLLFNMLSRLVIAFLPRSKHLLISWLQLPSAVILEPKKIK